MNRDIEILLERDTPRGKLVVKCEREPTVQAAPIRLRDPAPGVSMSPAPNNWQRGCDNFTALRANDF